MAHGRVRYSDGRNLRIKIHTNVCGMRRVKRITEVERKEVVQKVGRIAKIETNKNQRLGGVKLRVGKMGKRRIGHSVVTY